MALPVLLVEEKSGWQSAERSLVYQILTQKDPAGVKDYLNLSTKAVATIDALAGNRRGKGDRKFPVCTEGLNLTSRVKI